MTLTLKDFIYISTFLSALIGVFYNFKFRVKRIEEKYSTIHRIIFLDKGGLNIVTNDALSSVASGLQKNIDSEASISKEAFDQIKDLSDNVLIIMTHMNIPPKKRKRKL